jgi:hypothetical protein
MAAIYSYEIWDGTNPSVSGTASVTADSGTVTGSGTSFTTQLAVGDVVKIAGVYHVITVITNNTSMGVEPAAPATASGQTITRYPMDNVEDQLSVSTPIHPPKHDFIPYSQSFPLGDGTLIGQGWPLASWHWDFLTQAQRNLLKGLCSGRSVETFVSTRDFSRVFKTYSAVMVWPEREEYVNGVIVNFTIDFRKLVGLFN